MDQEILANWNGIEMPLKDVKVSVLDRGFMFGDAVYELIRIYAGKFFHLNDHLSRLENSLNSLKISGVDISLVRERLQQTLEHTGLKGDARAFIQVTRGEAPRSHSYPDNIKPNMLIYVELFIDPYIEQRKNGAALCTYKDIRWARNDIKTTSLAANCMAAQYAHEHGCTEVVFINAEGFVTEGSHTSIFGVKDGKLIVAPSSANVLPGITKKLILGLAETGNIPLMEMQLKQQDIFLLDEMFITGSSREIVPVVTVDERPIGGGKPGPVVAKLQKLYKELIDEAIGEKTGAA